MKTKTKNEESSDDDIEDVFSGDSNNKSNAQKKSNQNEKKSNENNNINFGSFDRQGNDETNNENEDTIIQNAIENAGDILHSKKGEIHDKSDHENDNDKDEDDLLLLNTQQIINDDPLMDAIEQKEEIEKNMTQKNKKNDNDKEEETMKEEKEDSKNKKNDSINDDPLSVGGNIEQKGGDDGIMSLVCRAIFFFFILSLQILQ